MRCQAPHSSRRFAPAFAALLFLQLLSPVMARQAPPEESGKAAGRLEVVAAVVGADLAVHPLPKFRFLIRSRSGEGPAAAPGAGRPDEAVELVTGFDGRGAIELVAGPWRLTSAEPLTWETGTLMWDLPFEITADATTTLEVSNDNARKEKSATSRVTDEARVFESARGAVFLIEADAGQGSGFLVDAAGLIITNHHVAGKAGYLAVRLNPRTKYPATLLSMDAGNDIAVLRVHPDAVAGIAPLPLQHETRGGGSVTPGERVIAIGSPLSQEGMMTTGVVSKVQEGAIMSDVNINPGNSGGPLLNIDGEVIGVNTFGIADRSGPGISGVVRIHVVTKALTEARTAVAAAPPPPFRKLPVPPELSYPTDGLKKLLTAEPDVKGYHLEAGKMDLNFFTPPFQYSLEKQAELRAARERSKRRKGEEPEKAETGDDLYQWKKEAGAYDAIVRIEAIPEITMTGGSRAGRIFGALGGVVTPARYRFKTEFRAMKLLRDGKEVTPIVPGRVCNPVSFRGFNTLEDIGCFGQYTYAPDDFKPGGVIELMVFEEQNPDKPITIKLDEEMIQRIWDDFAPWREAGRSPAGGGRSS